MFKCLLSGSIVIRMFARHHGQLRGVKVDFSSKFFPSHVDLIDGISIAYPIVGDILPHFLITTEVLQIS